MTGAPARLDRLAAMTSGPERSPVPAPDEQEYTLRRAPRLSAAVLVSVLAGLLLALIGTTLVHAAPRPPVDPYSGAPLSFGSTFGYMLVAAMAACMLVGLLVWLLLDRRSRRTERTVILRRTDDPAQADVTLHRAEAEALRPRRDTDPSDGRTTEP